MLLGFHLAEQNLFETRQRIGSARRATTLGRIESVDEIAQPLRCLQRWKKPSWLHRGKQNRVACAGLGLKRFADTRRPAEQGGSATIFNRIV